MSKTINLWMFARLYRYHRYVPLFNRTHIIFIPDSKAIFSHGHQNQNYELYAFVEHVGDLWNGHYTATIKADKGWHKFNDSSVRLVRPVILTAELVKNASKSICCAIMYYSTKKRLISCLVHFIYRFTRSHSRLMTL